MAIEVTAEVMDGLEAVRASGETNMLDRTRVIELLDQLGFDQAATWVAENKRKYSQGVFSGFEAK